MRAHLAALADHLRAATPLAVHLYRAEGPSEGVVPRTPFLVLRGGYEADEDAVCGESDGLDATARVTCTADSADSAALVADRVREVLSPRRGWSRVPMAGRVVEVRLERVEVEPQSDLDLRLPNSDRHPGFCVLAFRLVSQPSRPVARRFVADVDADTEVDTRTWLVDA